MFRRRHCAIWAICIFAVLFLAAPEAEAELRFDATSVHLGNVRSSVPVHYQFAFVNDGPGVVEITEARPGCGCLKPHLEKLRFAPGERGSVPLEIHTLGQAAGPHTWHLTLLYKDGDQLRETDLQVSAEVVTEVSVQPASVLMDGAGRLIGLFALNDTRPTPLRIDRVETTAPWLTARASPMGFDRPGGYNCNIQLIADETCPVGRHEASVVVHTNDPLYRQLQVSVTVVKRASETITAMPAELTAGTAPRLVRLHDQHDRPVVVEGVTAGHPAVVCQWAPGPGNQATIKVALDRTKGTATPLTTQVQVQIASPVREVLTIPVHILEE